MTEKNCTNFLLYSSSL